MDDDKYTLYCLGEKNKVEMVRPNMTSPHVTVAMMTWLALPGRNAVLENQKTGTLLMPEITFRVVAPGGFNKNQVVID